MGTRAQQLTALAVERRVLSDLEEIRETPSARRRSAVLAAAVVLFGVAFAARLSIDDPNALIANFYTVPIAVLAIEFGIRGGLLSAAFAFLLVWIWGVVQTVHVGTLGYVSRGAAFLLTGALVGRFSEQVRRDIAGRRRAQRQLVGYADELERSNEHLALSNARLEAFAQIARTVGGETDLERVLLLILEQGREIVGARGLLVCVPDADDLKIVAGSALADGAPTRLPRRDSLVGQVFDSGRPRLPDIGSLRRAAATADAHLGAELRRLRDLIAELRPAALDDLGLGPAIETLAARQAAAGGFTIAAEITLHDGERLPREIESTIYRVVQEALNNAAKHAAATHVRVAVSGGADEIEIRVEDDGCGFDPNSVSGGFGLTGMRERTMLAGGRLAIHSQPGGPTRVSAVLPGVG